MKLSADDLKKREAQKKSIAALTCYDYQMACWLNETELDFLLVGDSLSQVIYGHPTTKLATMDMMCRHTDAVVRGATKKHVMSDMPYGTYNNVDDALANARKLKSCGADSVKLENPSSEVVKALVAQRIDVCGHIGLLPQTHSNYKRRGKKNEEAKQLVVDALRLQESGCFSILIEAVVPEVAKQISQQLAVPTIGIASGENICRGKILVLYDLLGITYDAPSFTKNLKEASLGKSICDAVNAYCKK